MKKKSLFLSTLAVTVGLALMSPMVNAAPLPVATAGQPLPSLAPMLEKVLPAVVNVYVTGTQMQQQRLPEEFKFFFGPNFPTNRKNIRPFEGLGSGVIIDAAEGYVLTNNHVINNANKIRVQLNDGREYDAKLLGRDEQTDLALLKLINAKNLTAVSLANSDNLRVGDFAVAVGNPFGLGQTATSGIISALGRSGLNLEGLENFIQTDASINRGNSGGALVNLNGELIGINTAILAPGGGNIGIGFAIPSNMAQNLSQQLIQFGEVKRGVLGITGREMTADMAKALNVDIQRGAFVSEVIPNSAAAKAGIKAGDILVSINGNSVRNFAELRAKVGTTGPGKTIKIGLLRAGKLQDLTVTLGSDSSTTTNAETLSRDLQGATFSDGKLKNNDKGVKIDKIEQASLAEKIGLQKGDVITAVNNTRVENIAQLRKIINAKPVVMILSVIRGEEEIRLVLLQ